MDAGNVGDTAWLTSEQQATWRLWLNSGSNVHAELARQLQTESNISFPDYEVLVQLSESAEQRLRMLALADSLHWDRSRLSHQITRMCKRGLVRRELCDDDRRGAYVALEPEGLKTLQDAAPGHVRKVRELLMAPLTEEEFSQLGVLLGKIHARFEESDS